MPTGKLGKWTSKLFNTNKKSPKEMTIQIQTLNKTCNRIWSEKVEGGLGKEFGRNESYFMKVSYKI
jgi:hypothetical protein